ncbi:MAG: BspA family leucine-rich repeat surface protein [Oscillospiraceae bacterium]|nr:BspA family leucine-rich repeat surface protein [Oscillospiraceae bacterium]
MNYCKYCMSPLTDGVPCPCGLNEENYVPAFHQLQPGTVLQGRYLVGKVLGEGGFGITYVGRELKLGLKIAIKEYYPSGSATRTSSQSSEVHSAYGNDDTFAKGKEKFLNEAKTMALLDRQPHIVAVKDYFEENNTAYIVMEYVEGTTLKELTKEKGGKIPASELLELIKPMFSALGRMHSLGLIHRDISPDNLMIENGSIKLLDFGCAKDLSSGEVTQAIVLKHGYAPLEQYQRKGQGPWTDVYALAAAIYYCLTGTVPARATDRIIEDELIPPNKNGANLTSQQEKALMKALALKAPDRYQSMEEFENALYGNKTSKKKKNIAKAVAAVVLCGVIAVGIVAGVRYFIPSNQIETVKEDPESDEISTYRVLDNDQIRDYPDKASVDQVRFLDITTAATDEAWDFSIDGDGSVLAWIGTDGKDNVLYIAAEGGVISDESMYMLFWGYSAVNYIDLSGLDTSNVTTMYAMFLGCESLVKIDFGDIDTSKVEDMASMFESCKSLESIDVSKFDTSNVTAMSAMFSLCKSLTRLDLSNFDTSNVTMMDYMFRACESLTSLNLSSFDTSNVEDISYMFYYCSSLEKDTFILPSDFGNSAIYRQSTFSGCSVSEDEATYVNANTLDSVYLATHISNNTYYNQFADFTFSPPDSWLFYDDDNLLRLTGVDSESVSTVAERREVMAKETTIYSAVAYDKKTDAKVVIVFVNRLTLTAGTSYDAESYMDSVIRSTTGSNLNTSCTFSEVELVTIGSHEYYQATADVERDGEKLTQRFLTRQIDYSDYICYITITSYEDSPTVDEIMAMFS